MSPAFRKSLARLVFPTALACCASAHAQAPAATPPASPPVAAAAPTAKPAKNDYAKPSAWLCRPGRKDACSVDLTTTVVAADGTLTREKWVADRKAPIDCFYVYPTVSADKTPNSDMRAGPEEKNVVLHQLARFGSRCRLYAPLYRQVTLTALRAGMAGKTVAADRELAFNDVADAWSHYLAHDNKGRGVVLIGHSQGARVLTDLVAKQIDGTPVESRIVSALLIGTAVGVPKGAVVGGSFKHMPLCRSATQTGCVISYASFRASAPPPANSRFGKAPEGQVAACTSPAALAGGAGELHAYLSAKPSLSGSSLPPGPWVTPARPINTTFVSVPGLLKAECATRDNASYLAVTVQGNPADPRTDDIVGDIVTAGQVQADWGLHVIDVSLTIGNLLEIVKQQSTSYTAAAAAQAQASKTAPAAAPQRQQGAAKTTP